MALQQLPPEPEPDHPDDPLNATEQTPLLDRSGSSSGANGTVPRRPQLVSTNSSGPSLGFIRGTCVAFSMWILIFIQCCNMSGMTIIQGTIAADFEAFDSAMWATTAYLIPMSSLAPLAGRLTTIFPTRSLALPIGVFVAAGGLVTAFATSFPVFILGRVLTGVGGAGVMTLALILALELSGKKRRGLLIGLVNSGFTVGVSTGAVVFGALLPHIGWRPLFWIQSPVGLLAALGVYFSIPSSMSSGKSGSVLHKLLRIDYLGALLLISTIVLFLYGLAGDIQLWPLLASLGSLILFVAVEYLVSPDPIIPLKVLSSRGVLLSCLAQLGLMSVRWSVLFYAPTFMLAVRGAEPAAAGSVLIPTNAGFGFGGLLIGWLHVRRSGAFWFPTLVAMALFSVTTYAITAVATPESSLAAFIILLFTNGAVTGAALNYTLAHMLHLTYHDTQSISTSLLGTFRGLGGSFGTSIGGGIFYRLLRSQLTSGFLNLDGTDELSPSRQRLVSRLLGTPQLVFHSDLGSDDMYVAMHSYAGAARGVWQAAATLGLLVIVIQAATGWTAPKGKDQGEETESYREEEEEARALVTENEGLGEA